MRTLTRIAAALSLTALLAAGAAFADDDDRRDRQEPEIQLGPRPFFLLEGMRDGPLKRRLEACRDDRFRRSNFSIGHRGAPLLFPEHTLESYQAAARMGAGIIECDVTFTRDRELVCRHSQCDLHTTTNILATDLAAKCSQAFTPYDPVTGTDASARCCTSDITLAEFKTLQGKMDAADSKATTVEQYISQQATAPWRSDLYSGRGTLLTHRESIELFGKLGVGMAPELKSPSVAMPFEGDYTRQIYARQMIDEYRQAGVDPRRVWAQSFDLDDLQYWIDNEPRFGRQAVYLDSRPYSDENFRPTLSDFDSLKQRGVAIVAPPMFALLDLDRRGRIVPSKYARLAKIAGLDLITWTFERTDLRGGGAANPFYYRSIGAAIEHEGDKYLALDVLARQVGVIGVFSDWPATVTYYANCMGLE